MEDSSPAATIELAKFGKLKLETSSTSYKVIKMQSMHLHSMYLMGNDLIR